MAKPLKSFVLFLNSTPYFTRTPVIFITFSTGLTFFGNPNPACIFYLDPPAEI